MPVDRPTSSERCENRMRLRMGMRIGATSGADGTGTGGIGRARCGCRNRSDTWLQADPDTRRYVSWRDSGMDERFRTAEQEKCGMTIMDEQATTIFVTRGIERPSGSVGKKYRPKKSLSLGSHYSSQKAIGLGSRPYLNCGDPTRLLRTYTRIAPHPTAPKPCPTVCSRNRLRGHQR